LFAQACSLAAGFTRPIVIATRYFDNSLSIALGSFVILNPDGWILTAAHIVTSQTLAQQHAKEIASYQEQLQAVEQSPNHNAKQRQSLLRHIHNQRNPKWITHHRAFCFPDTTLTAAFAWLDADLAVAHLQDFDPASVAVYPRLKNPNDVPLGSSLCTLGFPFQSAPVSFNAETGYFRMGEEEAPATNRFFAIDSILSSYITTVEATDDNPAVRFLELSSPGLPGHSGGPIFDTRGTVWGIQSQTMHYPMGFEPTVQLEGRRVVEHQFFNVGRSIHPETMVGYLNHLGIQFQLSDY
jgi:hypothetical protein